MPLKARQKVSALCGGVYVEDGNSKNARPAETNRLSQIDKEHPTDREVLRRKLQENSVID